MNRLVTSLSLLMLVTLFGVANVAIMSCTGTPDERATKVAKAESDLCKLRAVERNVEEAIPSTVPLDGSPRAKIEAAEDAFCAARAAMLADAGGGAGASP